VKIVEGGGVKGKGREGGPGSGVTGGEGKVGQDQRGSDEERVSAASH